jgi:hypothetical protein
MRSVLFWDITQRRVLLLHRRFGKLIGFTFKNQESHEEFLTLDDGTNRSSLKISMELKLYAA